MRPIQLLGLMMLCTLLALGCGKKVPPVASVSPPQPALDAAPPPPSPAVAPARTTAPAAALSDDEIFARKTLDQLNAERPLSDVYFELDNWVIGEEGRATLQKNAAWLMRWPSTRVTIEGHCDDRGTGEYNLALGERRANAVREYLGNLGVPPDRVLVISKGEESPVCRETDESCRQQNRRGHPILTAK